MQLFNIAKKLIEKLHKKTDTTGVHCRYHVMENQGMIQDWKISPLLTY